MRNILTRAMLLAIAGMAVSSAASAQSPNGFASIVHVPVVVNSGTFQSTIFVHNPNGSAVNVQINYNGAFGTGSAGFVDCGSHAIAAGTTAEFDFGTVCTLTGASNFGTMRIWETESTTRPIAAYTRVQAFTGNGFSVEGFPIGGFANDNGASVALGLRRQAAAPTYQTNCFVSSIGEPVSVDMKLFDGTNTQLGTTQTIAVGANGTTRLSDVFAMAGAAAGDYSNVRAEFSQAAATVGNPSYSAFCTVQNNTSFDADFRIAKTVTPDDATTLYSSNQPKDGFGENLIVPANMKAVFGLFVRHPDFVSCRTVGSQVDNTEIRLVAPNGAIVAGGDNITGTGELFTGEKSTVNNGSNGMWRLEVGSRDGLGLEATKYNIQCASGNGSNRPLLIGFLPDDY
jgi:hypothetical protein